MPAFTKVKMSKQPRCPLTEEWMKSCGIYTMEHYSSLRKSEILSFVTAWMGLDSIMLN